LPENLDPLIKVFHIAPMPVRPRFPPQSGKVTVLSAETIDLFAGLRGRGTYGGTGTSFHWQIAKAVASKFSVMIAGGLTRKRL